MCAWAGMHGRHMHGQHNQVHNCLLPEASPGTATDSGRCQSERAPFFGTPPWNVCIVHVCVFSRGCARGGSINLILPQTLLTRAAVRLRKVNNVEQEVSLVGAVQPNRSIFIHTESSSIQKIIEMG